MPFLTKDQVEKRLTSPENLVNRLSVLPLIKKSELKETNLSAEERRLLADLAQGDDTQKEIAETFGVSQVTVSGLKRGLVGSNKEDSESADAAKVARERIEEKKSAASEKALDGLVEALGMAGGLIGEVKKAKTATAIAKDMAIIHEKLSGGSKDKGTNGGGVHVHLYAPRVRDVSEYEIVDVVSS